MLLLWLIGSAISGAIVNISDDLRYGYPRTSQVDEKFLDGDKTTPSHVLATNHHGRVIVVVFPHGDVAKTQVYEGPLLQGNDRAPVILDFRDANHDGKRDLVVTIGALQTILINTGSKLRTAKPGEV